MSTKRTYSYFANLGYALTRLLAALIGADYRVAFSTQCWVWENQGKLRGKIFRPIVDKLFWWDPMHCFHSYQNFLNTYRRENRPVLT